MEQWQIFIIHPKPKNCTQPHSLSSVTLIMTETSPAKTYYLLNIGTSQNIGCAPIVDQTLRPKPILTLPPRSTINGQWNYEPLSGNHYKLNIKGASSGVTSSRPGIEKDFITAVIQDGAGGKIRPWALEQWKEGNIGPAYTIRDPENSSKVWTVSDEVERSLGDEYKPLILQDYQVGNLKQVFAFMTDPVGVTNQ